MKKILSTLLTIVLSVTLLTATLGFDSCPGGSSNFDRAVAALNTAPLLIDSFVNATPAQKEKLKGYFVDGVKALKAYKAVRSDENWSAFLSVLTTIADHQLSDVAGAARIRAIIGVVKVILGIGDVPLTHGMGAAQVSKPDLGNVKSADVKRLEELMKPLN